MDLSFSSVDKYSFKISNGDSIATVRATATTDAGSDGINLAIDTAGMKAEIEAALSAANISDITVTAKADGKLTLTNIIGGKIDVSNFKSDGRVLLQLLRSRARVVV